MYAAFELGRSWLGGAAPEEPDYSQMPKDQQLTEYVKRENIAKAIKLLAEGVDPNIRLPEDDTLLHAAVRSKNKALVKMLIVFNADLTLKNRFQQTALDLAEADGAQEVAQIIKQISDLEKDLDSDKPRSTAHIVHDPEDRRLLSLDGGGIRGLVFTQVLLEMEKRKTKLYPGDHHTVLSHFEWLAGTSTGGFSALSLATPKDPAQLRQMYLTLKEDVMGSLPPIPNDMVNTTFKKLFGESTTMADIKEKRVAIMTTLSTQSPPILHVMTNYGKARNNQPAPDQQLVWKAARSTTALPLFYHPVDNVFIDGGLIANNPTVDAIIDLLEYAKEQKEKVKLKVVLSLGCGFTQSRDLDDVDYESNVLGDAFTAWIKMFHQATAEQVQLLCLIMNNVGEFKRLMDILISQIIQPNGEVLKRAEFISEAIGAKYFRIDPPIGDVPYVITDNLLLINMLYDVRLYVLKHCREIIDPALDAICGK